MFQTDQITDRRESSGRLSLDGLPLPSIAPRSSLDKALPSLPNDRPHRRASFDSINSVASSSSSVSPRLGSPSRRRFRQHRDSDPDASLDLSTSLTSFPTPPSSIPTSISLRSLGVSSNAETVIKRSSIVSASRPRVSYLGSEGTVRSVHSRQASVQSTFSNETVSFSELGHGHDGARRWNGPPSPQSVAPSLSAVSASRHRSRVSLDVPQPSLAMASLAAASASASSNNSVRSVSPRSTRSRTSLQHPTRSRSARIITSNRPAIPQRKRVVRMSMPSSMGMGSDTFHVGHQSAVTPDFERPDPIHLRSVTSPSSLASHSTRPTSPLLSDDEDDMGSYGYDTPRSFTPHSPNHQHAALRMAPGVVGLGEGWAGGPQPKRRTRFWWRRRRTTSAIDEDPLALWTVPEENAKKTSPLKSAWNRSKVAFGLGSGKEREDSNGSPSRSKSTVQRAKAFFSRSRLDLVSEDEPYRWEEASNSGLGLEAIPDIVPKPTPKAKRRFTGLFSRSQNDLDVVTPTINRQSHEDRKLNANTPRSHSAKGLAGSYGRRYAASQPHLPSPRSTSLLPDSPSARGLPPPWRPASSLASGRTLTVPRIVEVDERSASAGSLSQASSRRRGKALKRSSTFGNGAEDIAAELGLAGPQRGNVALERDLEDEFNGSEDNRLRSRSATPKLDRRASVPGKPLFSRLKSSFTSMTSMARPLKMASAIPTTSERTTRSQPGSEDSSSPPSTMLRTPIIDTVTTIPLAPEAPMGPEQSPPRQNRPERDRKRHSTSGSKPKRRASWLVGLRSASTSKAKLDLLEETETDDRERETTDTDSPVPVRPQSRSMFRRRKDTARRASLGGALDLDDVRNGDHESRRNRKSGQEDTKGAGWKRRSFAASVPALNRLSGSEYNLLRFSFPKEDMFAGIFDGIRSTPRGSPARRESEIVPNPPVVDMGERNDALAGTMEILEGRRSEGHSRNNSAVIDLSSIAPTSTPVPPSVPMETEQSDSAMTVKQESEWLASGNSRSSVTLGREVQDDKGQRKSTAPPPMTPVRSQVLSGPSLSPLVTPNSVCTEASEQPSLSTLAPHGGTPRTYPPIGNINIIAPTPSPTLAPTASFAWASRPGLPPRTGSFSSMLSSRTHKSGGSVDSGTTASGWFTAQPSPKLGNGTPPGHSPHPPSTPSMPTFPEENESRSRAPSFGSAMRPYVSDTPSERRGSAGDTTGEDGEGGDVCDAQKRSLRARNTDVRASKSSLASQMSSDDAELIEEAVEHEATHVRQISDMTRKGSLVAVHDLMGMTPRQSLEASRA